MTYIVGYTRRIIVIIVHVVPHSSSVGREKVAIVPGVHQHPHVGGVGWCWSSSLCSHSAASSSPGATLADTVTKMNANTRAESIAILVSYAVEVAQVTLKY